MNNIDPLRQLEKKQKYNQHYFCNQQNVYSNLVKKFSQNSLIFQVFSNKIPNKKNILKIFLVQVCKINFLIICFLMFFSHTNIEKYRA